MSFKDKLQSWIDSTDDGYIDGGDSSDDFDFRPDDPEEQPAPQQTRTPLFHSRSERSSSNVVNINGPKVVPPAKPRVVFQKIDSFAEVTKVADVLKEKRIVVLNLEACPNTDAQRIIDMLFGVSYANDGDFKKIADRAYIITPNNVPVSGELGDDFVGAGFEE